PERRGVGGQAHRVTGARQRLVENGADRAVVVGDQDIAEAHAAPSLAFAANAGMRIRNVVRLGCDSHSTMPPWSRTILETSARPRPVPRALVVTNGSNRCGRSSSGTPGPLSR